MPFSAKQLKHLEARLLEERARVVRNLDTYKQNTSTDDQQERNSDLSKFPTHAADLGTDVQDEELDASIATRQSSELVQIDDALDRLRNTPDQFGLAEGSGDEIPFARLDIIPWTRSTIDGGTPKD